MSTEAVYRLIRLQNWGARFNVLLLNFKLRRDGHEETGKRLLVDSDTRFAEQIFLLPQNVSWGLEVADLKVHWP